ncbi:hypothetical protein [Sphingobium sp.]|uniref:hypothetical protein n=1 Tax=Sphingobium sp. TaxID=1912891 RepID=UPI003BB57569
MLLDSDFTFIEDTDLAIPSTRIPEHSADRALAPAFKALNQIMKDCLSSHGKPLFYVAPIACGGGKSTLVQQLLKKWKFTGFKGNGSAIIMLSTLAEVDTYVVGAELEREDYACLSPDPKYSGYGRGRGRASDARILFVTHEHARRRMLERKSFLGIAEYHYQGSPRSLRIWDEGIDPAVPISFKLSQLETLPDVVRVRDPDLANMIEAMRLDNADRKDGHVLFVPAEIGKAASKFALDQKGWLQKATAKILEGLAHLAGRQAILRRDNHDGLFVVGSGAPLPDDLAPLIILDGSANLRPSYKLWSSRSDMVQFLDPIAADYSSLTLRWWNKGANNSTLNSPVEREKVVHAVTDAISSKPDENWLIIHFNKVEARGPDAGYNIIAEIEDRIPSSGRVQFLNWGRHMGSNAYRHIKNVIIIGCLNYGQPGYAALHAVATGTLAPIDQQSLNSIARGEFAHHVYQAACRSNLRNIAGGVAGNATVYLIAPDRANRQPLLEKAFKGCIIEAWEPIPPAPKPREQLVIETMSKLFEGSRIISIKQLYEACGGNNADYLRRIWKKKSVIDFIDSKGIKRRGNKLMR